MAAPVIRYGGDSVRRPRTVVYQSTAASTSGTQMAVWARPVSTGGASASAPAGPLPHRSLRVI